MSRITAALRKFFETGLRIAGIKGDLQRGEIPYGAGNVDELEAGGLVLTQGQSIIGGPQGVPVATGGAAVALPPVAQSSLIHFAINAASDSPFRFAKPFHASGFIPYQDDHPRHTYVVDVPGTLRSVSYGNGFATTDPVIQIIVNDVVEHEFTIDNAPSFTVVNVYDISGGGVTLSKGDRLQIRVKEDLVTQRNIAGTFTFQLLHDDDSEGGFILTWTRQRAGPNFQPAIAFAANGAVGALWHHLPIRIQIQSFGFVSESADGTTRIPINAGRSFATAINNRIGTLVIGSAIGAASFNPAINVEAATYIGFNPLGGRIIGTDPEVTSIYLQGVALSS